MKAKPLFAATLALTIASALALSALTGVALADKPDSPGNSEDAPGQVKQAEEAPTPTPAAAPAKEQKAATKSSAKSTQGSAKQEARASGPGVKPSNSTSKWTTCSTGGGQGTSATCSGTHSSKADSSKQYGNGKTAAQIANSRGAPAGTKLTGPGNSQPHKVAVCPKDANKSGGVDVHAVKSYDTSACAEQQPEAQKPAEQPSACPPATTQVVTSSETVVMHHAGPTKVIEITPSESSAHYKNKHPDDLKTTTVTQTIVTAGVCAAEQPTQQQVLAEVKPAEAAQQPAAAQQEQGGVLGAQAVVRQPAKQPVRGGVAGRIGAVAQQELPFTGLPLWIAVLAGAALVGAGAGIRRSRS